MVFREAQPVVSRPGGHRRVGHQRDATEVSLTLVLKSRQMMRMTLRSLIDVSALGIREADHEALRTAPGPTVGTVRGRQAVTARRVPVREQSVAHPPLRFTR